MGYAQVSTVTSTNFLRNASAAKRIADAGGTVIITDRGKPAVALLPITEYQRLTRTSSTGRDLLQRLRTPAMDAYNDFDPQPIKMQARGIDE